MAGCHELIPGHLHHDWNKSCEESRRINLKDFQKCICLPITVDIMEHIYSILRGAPMAYNSVILWAACCTAFFGFLRVSELTAPSLTQYDPEVHLSLADVALDSHH